MQLGADNQWVTGDFPTTDNQVLLSSKKYRILAQITVIFHAKYPTAYSHQVL